MIYVLIITFYYHASYNGVGATSQQIGPYKDKATCNAVAKQIYAKYSTIETFCIPHS